MKKFSLPKVKVIIEDGGVRVYKAEGRFWDAVKKAERVYRQKYGDNL